MLIAGSRKMGVAGPAVERAGEAAREPAAEAVVFADAEPVADV